MTATALPSGVSRPPTVDRKDNHGGLVVVITGFCLVLVLSSLAARTFSLCKRRVIQKDDYGFMAVVVVALSQTSLVLAQAHYGWGATEEVLSSATEERMLKMGYASDILFIVTLGLSKITTTVFYMTLFKQKLHAVIRGLLVGGGIWVILSVILVAVRCSHRPWLDIDAQCSGLFQRWQAITAIDVIIEVLLILYSARAIYSIKISTLQKIVVFGTLSCRTILIPLSATHLYYIKVQLDSDNPTLYGAFASITAELYLAMSVVCLVASFMKPVLAVYVDEYGIAYTDEISPPNSKLRSHTSSESRSRRLRRSETEYDRSWERMPDRTIPAASGGRIMKTVQISVSDGPMELERREPEVVIGV
ncbi:hypothetical protein KXV22_001851 [Aspergillus fumigatus]|nr:hypothetical protein KXX10_003645 [Aspergillus fumigatus]KAH1396314.1 hypothetical protein KXX49_008082 [Aspergillus fumigatus]KAH1606942.1 hypothetical protein KXX44_000126 [Aspergillus fumigatus]KAH1619263.1 hypothetical protein KXX31_008884 [Aspergillus fumigatus]KAH1792169.1 hypothetical protein KXX20_006458 [Aspergillus fumigatus]